MHSFIFSGCPQSDVGAKLCAYLYVAVSFHGSDLLPCIDSFEGYFVLHGSVNAVDISTVLQQSLYLRLRVDEYQVYDCCRKHINVASLIETWFWGMRLDLLKAK